MTSNLSRAASDLVREGRRALRPSDAERARVFAAIRSRLVVGNVSATDQVPLSVTEAQAGGIAVGKLAILVAGLVTAFSALVVLSRGREERQPEEVEPPSPTVSMTADASTSVNAGEPVVSSAPEVASAAPEGHSPRSGGRAKDADRLAEEVNLLMRAEREFHAGNLKRALALTDEHRQKFPKGALTQERIGLRLQALCGVGREEEARAEATSLKRLTQGRTPSTNCGAVR